MNTTDINLCYFEAKREYRYLWLKYIDNVDLSVHCAKCLKGTYENRLKPYIYEGHGFNMPEAKVYYLCGVAMDRKWIHNLHVAFVKAVGQSIVIDDEFCRLKIENARRLDISTKDIDWSLPQSHKKEYCTCRNWQFANMINKGIYRSFVPKIKLQMELFDEET